MNDEPKDEFDTLGTSSSFGVAFTFGIGIFWGVGVVVDVLAGSGSRCPRSIENERC